MRQLLAVLIAAALLAATVDGVLCVAGREGGPSWRPVGEIVALSIAWLLANDPFEGRVLWVPVDDHGLTVADLAIVPPLVVALLVAIFRVTP